MITVQAINKGERYTYSDYATWNDDNRYELIDGAVHMLASPSVSHQRISRELSFQLTGFLKGKSCEVFTAPIDVRLNVETKDDTVVQPDLIVVCDHTKIDSKSYKGAPDMVIEILSPSSGKHDRIIKFNKYLQAGVREYWIVDPADKTVSVHVLENSKYVTNAYCDTDSAPVHILESCVIDLGDVFAE